MWMHYFSTFYDGVGVKKRVTGGCTHIFCKSLLGMMSSQEGGEGVQDKQAMDKGEGVLEEVAPASLFMFIAKRHCPFPCH